MLNLKCPYCEVEADETELANGGEAHIKRASVGSSDAEFEEYLFIRKNVMGVHFERWRHAYGCGKWFHAARCTLTMEVFGTYPAQTYQPPPEILNRIFDRRNVTYSEYLSKDANKQEVKVNHPVTKL